MAEIEFTSGGNLLLAPAGLLAHLFTVAVFLAAVRAMFVGRGSTAKRSVLGLILVLLFFTIDMGPLTRGDSQTQWIPFVTVFSVAAFAAMGQAMALPPDHRTLLYLLSFVASAAATASGIVGILVWPALLFAVIVSRGGGRAFLWLALTTVVVLVPFFQNNAIGTGTPSGGVVAQLSDPLHLFTGLASFVGMPVSAALFVQPFARWSFEAGVGIGSLILALQVWFLADGLLRRRAGGFEAFALAMLIFTLLCGAAFTIKRFEPGAPVASFDRFWQIILMCWVITALLAWRRWAPVSAFGIKCLILVGLGAAGLFAPKQLFVGIDARANAVRTDALGSAIAVGVHDQTLHQRFSYDTGTMSITRAYLRQRRLRPVHDAAARAMGSAVGGTNIVGACGGRIDQFTATPGGNGARRVWGTWPAKVAAAADGITITDTAGNAVGMARAWRTPWQPKYFPRLGPKDSPGQWFGYIGASTGPPGTAYVLDAAGKATCRLGEIRG